MNLTTLLIALAASTAVSAKHYMHCPLALDGTKMLQDPYCCMGYKPAPNTKKAIEGQNCMFSFFLSALWTMCDVR